MDEQPLLERVAAAVEGMRPSERKVADSLLADPAAALDRSMAAMAVAARVSEPTVMRFCTALGFSGFQAFKYALAQTLALGMPATHSAIRPDDTVASVTGKIFDHTLTTLDRARRSLDTDQVAAAVDLVLGADELLFVGHGASGIIAQDALQHSVLFGVGCAAPTDLHQQFMAASTAGPGTVLVAISNTGRTTSVLEVAERARRSGASVIAVVGGPSPLRDLADVALVLRTFEDTDTYTPTVSRLAGLVLVDVLATAVAAARGPEHLDRIRRMKEELSTFRGSG